MPTTISASQLIPQIQLLLEERLKLVDAIAGIDETLAGIGSVLGVAASPQFPASPAPAAVKTAAKGKRRGRQTKFAVSAEDSILAFVKQSKNPTTKDVKAHWIATGGHTVPDLLKRVEKDVIAKKPTIVVIQIGCNDARRIPKDTFKNSLEELIDTLQKHKIQVIQCTLTSVGEKYDGTNKDDPKLEEFATVEREVAQAKGVPLNDLRKAFIEYWKKNNPYNKSSGLLTYDGNHWTDTGHQFVAEQMLKKIK